MALRAIMILRIATLAAFMLLATPAMAQTSGCTGNCAGAPRPPWCDGITCNYQGWQKDQQIRQLEDRVGDLERKLDERRNTRR
jgi:hypothetical protein